ncbi:MAG: hypothetical protein RLZZ253_2283 [Verrucomicrobiota bacterium]
MRLRELQMSVVACATAFYAMARAEEPAPRAVDTSVTGWLLEMKAGFEKAYRERVVDVHKAGLEEARKEYAEQLQLALKDAERAGDRQAAAVFRQEFERVAAEDWRMPLDDQDISLETLRRARRIYREHVTELNRAWDEASRKLVAEFDAALVQGAQRLTARNLEGEVRRVLACQQELVSVWLPRMWEIHRGTQVPVADGVGRRREGGWGVPSGNGVSVSRKELEETVKWVLEGKGTIQIRRNNQVQFLEKVGDLPGGKVEFWSVHLNRHNFGRALEPGELQQIGRFQNLMHLGVWAFSVPPEDWAFLAGLHRLQTVYISRTTLDVRLGRWLSQCSALSHLELTDCEGLSPEFFNALYAGVPGLVDLRMPRSRIQDTAGIELGRFERLESLAVDSTGLTSAVLPSWAGFRHLKKLWLFDGPWPREGLEALSRSPIERLGFLDSDNPELPAQMAIFGKLFPKLKQLDLRGKGLHANQAQALLEHRKYLEVLNLQWVLPSLEAVKILARLPRLRVLCCRAPGVGDELFQEFLAIRTLRELDVAYTGVSDQSAEAIVHAGINGLRVLDVTGTQISSGARSSLQRRAKGLSLRALSAEVRLER